MKTAQPILKLLISFLLIGFSFTDIVAQDVDTCPCENCPGLIEDNLRSETYQLNIFNVKNNSLGNADQCVSKVGIKFTHEYSGDLVVQLVSPGGDTVDLIGPVTFSQGENGQTDNRIFDIAFVNNSETAVPDENYDAKFSNDQNWAGQGILEGTYYPFKGSLADFDEGKVNGTWTLIVGDFNTERNDEGELIDFYVEFCDTEGLVCDPCLDPEDTPDCIFRIDAGEAIVVPDEVFCVPVYAENVAFLSTLAFPMTWNENVLEFDRVDSFQIEDLKESDFDLMNTVTGNLALNYNHTLDTLGLVVADSTPIFNVCFKAIGAVGDSSQINYLFPPIAVNVDGEFLLTDSIVGKVLVTVDSTADCVNAIQLCGSADISIDRTKGTGFDEMEGCSPSGQEFQSKWFRFDVLESGDFEFMVKPKGAAVFTYGLFKGACPNEGNSINEACETSIPPIEGSIIGLANNPTASFGDLGNAPTNFSAAISVTAGDTYFLHIDNASSNGIGFDLSFAGTAIIGDETLQAKIADPGILNCTNSTIRLDATQSTQGNRYIPMWTNNDGIIDFSTNFYQPLITEGGTFTLAIEDTRSGCVVKDSVFVATDMVFPEAIANGAGTIDCNAPTLVLNSEGSSMGDEFAFKWTNLDLAIPDLPTTTELTVEVAGNYEMEITNTVNGCVSKDSVLVTADFVDPQLTASDNYISCTEPLATLSATSTTLNVEYEWTGSALTTPEVTAEILVSDTGEYAVKVTALNGCSTTDVVFVRDDRVFPEVEAGDPFQLNCPVPTKNLNGEGSSTGSVFEYQWSTSNGHFVIGEDTTSLSPLIDEGGLYVLEVTNTSNGCVSLDSVSIDTSFKKPSIRIFGDTILNCFNKELTINASNSDSGAIYQFEWFGEDGNVLINDDTYRPKISQAGSYIFNITNTENGCFSTAVRTFTSDAEPPFVDAGPSDILSCNNNFVILDGTGSSRGSVYDYKWTTEDGRIIAETEGISAGTDSSGTYKLTVFDRSNGCSAADSVTIFQNFVKPAITIPPDTTLTCENPTLQLAATSVTENTDFLWIFPNGDTTLTGAINVLNPGTYSVTVTGENGCENNGDVLVGIDQDLPNIVIDAPETLTCLNQEVTIIGDKSDQSEELNFLWSTNEGEFLDENQFLEINPTVSKGGRYYLEILNTVTGCIKRDSIEVPSSVDNPDITIAEAPATYTCTNQRIPITATSSVENVQFQWKLELAVLAETPTFEANAPGIYSILVLNPANNCSTLSSVEVKADTLLPIANAGPAKELNCLVGNVTLDGGLSDKGDGFSYIWNAPSNEVFTDLIEIEATQRGLYSLIVLNNNNGCRSIDTVRVTESRNNPIADAGRDTTFCTGEEDLSFVLGGALTSQGSNFSYNWSDSKEIILGTEIQQNVNTTDTFYLKVINNDNQCESIDSVIVFEKTGPNVSIEKDGAIDCLSNQITYTAKSDISTSKIKWVGSFETFSEELTVTDALLNEDFIAIAEDTITGCLGQSVTVLVNEDRQNPLINAGEDTEVNCADTLRLDGQLSSIGIEINIEWRTEDGNVVSNKNDFNPIVDAAGMYILRIENTGNFCVSEDTVFISTDQVLPTVNLGKDLVLTCNESITTIEPDSISVGNNFYYTWKDVDNNIVARTDTLLVDLSGIYQLTVIDSSNLCSKSDVITVIDSLNPPFIEIETPDIITCINNQVVLNTISDSIDGSFQWTILTEFGHILGLANSPDLLVDSAGTYQIEVTNNFTGCQGVKNITVQDIRETIDIEAGSDKTITCFNDTTVLAAGTIFTQSDHLKYTWTANIDNFIPIDTTLLFTIDKVGTYFLGVMDTLSNCEARDSFSVAKNTEELVYEVGEALNLDCRADSVILGDLRDLGQNDYIYSWTTDDGFIQGSETEPLAVATSAGLYELFIQNNINGCTTTDTQRVVADILLPTVDVGEPIMLTCINELITIGGDNTTNGEHIIYEWTTTDGNILEGAKTPFAVINQGGNYQLSVLDTTNQCESNQSLLILEDRQFPEVDLPLDLDIDCTDDFVNILPVVDIPEDRVVVHWSTTIGELLSDSSSLEAQVGMPGSYFLKVIDTTNNCITFDTVEVFDNRQLPKVADLENRMLGCDETSITLDAQGSAFGDGISYEWRDESGRPLSNNTTLTIDMPGNYILQVSDASNNCVDTDTVIVTKNIDPPTSAFFDIISPSCDGIDNGYIDVLDVIGGTGPYRYSIDESAPNLVSIFSDLAPATYVYRITDELACTWDTTIVLNQPEIIEATISVSNDELVTGEVATFNVMTSIPNEDIVDIEWSPTEFFDCFNCQEVTTSFINNTTVGVTIVDVNGCESYASLDVEVALADVPNAITPNGDGANDFFIVPQIERDPDAYPESELIIFNRWGDVLFKISPYDNNWDGRNNKGESIVEGTYYYVLRLNTREGEFMKGDITIIRR